MALELHSPCPSFCEIARLFLVGKEAIVLIIGVSSVTYSYEVVVLSAPIEHGIVFKVLRFFVVVVCKRLVPLLRLCVQDVHFKTCRSTPDQFSPLHALTESYSHCWSLLDNSTSATCQHVHLIKFLLVWAIECTWIVHVYSAQPVAIACRRPSFSHKFQLDRIILVPQDTSKSNMHESM
eukprot:1498747-Amphidinium_carterae.1